VKYLVVMARGVVVRVPGYKYRGQGSIFGATRFSEPCPVSTSEELLERKSSGSGLDYGCIV
jgi:hypothetical protein